MCFFLDNNYFFFKTKRGLTSFVYPQEPSQKGILKSASLILMLTAIFGTLSYAFIQLNPAVMQLSVPESLWCGLAMSLAVVYYLFQKHFSKKEHD